MRNLRLKLQQLNKKVHFESKSKNDSFKAHTNATNQKMSTNTQQVSKRNFEPSSQYSRADIKTNIHNHFDQLNDPNLNYSNYPVAIIHNQH